MCSRELIQLVVSCVSNCWKKRASRADWRLTALTRFDWRFVFSSESNQFAMFIRQTTHKRRHMQSRIGNQDHSNQLLNRRNRIRVDASLCGEWKRGRRWMQFWIRKWHFEFVVYLFVNWKCMCSASKRVVTTANCTIYYFPTLNRNVVTQLLLCYLCSDSESIRIERISFLIYLFSAICYAHAMAVPSSGSDHWRRQRQTNSIYIYYIIRTRTTLPTENHWN